MTKSKVPIITITMGDPAGIGPEIAIKAMLNSEIYNLCKPVLIGDLKVLEERAKQIRLDVKFKVVSSPRNVNGEMDNIEVIDLNNIDVKKIKIGRINAEAGQASIDIIKRAVKYNLTKEAEALVTAPINKKAIRLAGSRFIGHTELIASLCSVKDPLTMFWVRGAKIFFLTRHIPLKDALQAVQKEKIVKAIIKIDNALRLIGVKEPSIAIAALNPHAGDGGLIGKEEEVEITPAIRIVRKRHIDVFGPISADSVFHQAIKGKYDAVLALYHDQGHIAAKTRDFFGTVAVTLGLPFIRTSVDHGTAYDIAGKGLANSKSLENAIQLAAQLATSTRCNNS